MSNKKRVIYIIGAGRSGTTLLDIILGSNPDIFSAGELNRFPKRNGYPPNIKDTNPAFLFWEKIRNEIIDNNNLESIYRISQKFEYHSGLLNIINFKQKKDYETYKSYIKLFFNSLCKHVTEYSIIDSSKYPMRAYYLSKILPIPIDYIYLKRNPLDVIRSFAKKNVEQPPKNWLMANIYLLLVNFLCLMIIKILRNDHRIVTISYDSLTKNPSKTLEKIENSLNINLQYAKQQINADLPLKPGFLFDGNRLRLKDEVILRKKNINSKKKISFKDRISLMIHYFWWRKS